MIKLTKPFFNSDEFNAVKKVLDGNWLVEGKYTRNFEKKISKFQKIKYVSALTSCTAGLHLAVSYLNLKRSDEIIVPAFSWSTTAHCVKYLGLNIRFVDIDIGTYNIDSKKIENTITKNTKAIIVVHLFGKSAEMNEIIKISKKYNLTIIEDCACALGTKYKGKLVGSFGAMSSFSFHPRKIITTGEGGAICTNNKNVYENIKSLKNHGCSGLNKKEKLGPWSMARVTTFGFNYRFNDILGSLGIQQMKKIKLIIKKRKKLAFIYSSILENYGFIVCPETKKNVDPGHTFQSYVVRIKSKERQKRNKIMSDLLSNNIETRPGTYNLTRLDCYKEKNFTNKDSFNNAQIAFNTTITLPLYHDLDIKTQEYICENLIRSCRKYL